MTPSWAMVLPVIEKQLIVWQQPTPCTFARCCRGWLLSVKIAHCIVSRVFLDPSSGMRPTGGFCATMAMVMTNGIPWLIALLLFAWNSWRTANGALTFFQYISSLLSPAARWGSLEFNLWRSSFFFFSSSFFFLSSYSYSTYLCSAIRFLCFAAGVLLLLLLWRWVSLVECHIASSECHVGHRDPIYIWRAQGDVEGWARSPNRKCCLLGRLDSSHVASSGCNGERLDRNICQTGCQNRMPYGMSDRMWNKMAEYRSNKLSDRLPEEKLNREAARLKLSRMSSKYEAHVFFHMLVKLKYDMSMKYVRWNMFLKIGSDSTWVWMGCRSNGACMWCITEVHVLWTCRFLNGCLCWCTVAIIACYNCIHCKTLRSFGSCILMRMPSANVLVVG